MQDLVSLSSDTTAFVLVDVQDRILQAMDSVKKIRFLEKTQQLTEACRILGVRQCYTEQNPQKLGPTDSSLLSRLSDAFFLEKMFFDACREQRFCGYLDDLVSGGVRSLIVAGIEAHVCVMLSALSMMKFGFSVFVPDDCVCSRIAADAESALSYMSKRGIQIVPSESLIFSLTARAGTDEFRQVLSVVK